MYLQNKDWTGVVFCTPLAIIGVFSYQAAPTDDKEYKHTVIRAKSAPYTPSAMYSISFLLPFVITKYV